MASHPSAPRRSPPKSRHQIGSPQQFKSQQPQVKQIDRSASLFIHLVRLMIFGLGASTIAGTTISVLDPSKQQLAKTVLSPLPQPQLGSIEPISLTRLSSELQYLLQAEIDRVRGTAANPNNAVDPSYLFVDIDSGEYSELGADRVLSAASTIKLPILIALFQDVDARKIQLDEQLPIDKRSMAGGSGDLQDRKPGTKVSILATATKMMTISDNTATNLLIERLGGAAALNQRFRAWGLNTTKIERPLPDLQGKNVTTVRELTRSLMAIERGKIVSARSRGQILDIMSNTTRNHLLPQGLGAGAKIAHKTGDIGSLIGDVGSIQSPTGKNYLAAVLVKRAHNDPVAPALIRQMSKIAYTYFHTTPSTSTPTPTPTPTSEFKTKVDPGFPNTVFIKKSE